MRLLQSCVLTPEFEDTYIAVYSVMSFEFVFVVASNISKIIPAQSVLKGDGIGAQELEDWFSHPEFS